MASDQEQQRLLWEDESWRAEAQAWAEARLAELGRDVVGPFEQPHVRAWATAFRIPTDAGVVWFKASIPSVAHEVATVELLAARCPDRVPIFLGGDRSRGWMLIEDAGERLRELDGETPQLERWAAATAAYAELQLAAARDVEAFVAAGVPDRRGPRLAQQLAELLEDERVLQPPTDAALTAGELRSVRENAVPRVAADVDLLESLAVPVSIQHDDLHDGNVFVHDGRYVVIDWGDASVASPLLSIDLTLKVLAHALEVPTDAPDVERVRAAYLEPFTSLEPMDRLLAATDHVRRAAEASNVIKWYEVSREIPEWSRADFIDGIPKKLRRLLELCD